MLGKYISFNGERFPNPVSYSASFGKISNVNQSESGKDLVKNKRLKKYTGNFTFNVSSYWKNKLSNVNLQPSVTLTVGSTSYNVRIEEYSEELVPYSELSDNTDGYWIVTFSAIEF